MPEPVPAPALTALEAGLIPCPTCRKVFESPPGDSHGRIFCSRCGEALHGRRPHSLVNTWALVLTAAILAFPANLLPIMAVDFMGSTEASTIMDGIIYFFKEGSYGIGIVILTASILVPLFKIIGLVMILLSVHFRWKSWMRHKTLMFHFIEFIGRWSMLDIFVIALLEVLAGFGFFTTIQAAPAATYFTAVVVFTMLAATSFDTRLLWDA